MHMSQQPTSNTPHSLMQLAAKRIQARFEPAYSEAGSLRQHDDAPKSQSHGPHLEFTKRIGNAVVRVEKGPRTNNVTRFEATVVDRDATRGYACSANDTFKPFQFGPEQCGQQGSKDFFLQLSSPNTAITLAASPDRQKSLTLHISCQSGDCEFRLD